MANECCGKDQDFVAYFFQKNGDTFVDAITKMQAEYAQKLSELYGCLEEDVKLRVTCFQSKILDPCRLSPTLSSVPQFDFLGTLQAAFSGLTIDVCEQVDKIAKYYDFIQSMELHWSGLEVDDKTVIDVAIQMMATLEAMIYPLFLKLSEFIIQLAANPDRQDPDNEPEIMMTRFHKIIEVVSLQIALIGESCVKTLGKSNCTTWDILEKDSRRIASQARDAKNCLAWSMKAVASVLIYYFVTRCNAGVCATAKCEQEECRLKQLAEESEKRIREQTIQAEAKIRSQVEDFELLMRNAHRKTVETSHAHAHTEKKEETSGGGVLLETEHKTEHKSEHKTEKKTSKKSSKKKDSKKSSKKSSKSKKNKKKKGKDDEENESVADKEKSKSEPQDKKDDEDASNANKERPKSESKDDKKDKKEDEEDASNAKKKKKKSKSKSKSKDKKKSKAKSHEDPVEPQTDFENTVTEGNKSGAPSGKDFVDYFFAKDGMKYILLMAERKKMFHSKCSKVLKGLDKSEREDATKFLEKLHNIRKVEPMKAVDMYTYTFYDDLVAEFKVFHYDPGELFDLIRKYEDYAKGMMKHWEFKVLKEPGKLEAAHIIDGGTQLMATTMSLVYPVFINFGEYIIGLTKDIESSKSKYPAQVMLEKCSRIVEIIALEMVAVSLTAISTFNQISGIKEDDLKKATTEMTIQARFAKNSIAWAIKSLSPVVFLYYLASNFPKASEEVIAAIAAEAAAAASEEKPVSKKKSKKKKSRDKEKKKDKKKKKTQEPEEDVQSTVVNSEQSEAPPPREDKGHHHGWEDTIKNEKIYLRPTKTYDFVDYFFQKEGEAYLKFLTDMLQTYEKLCNDTLPNSGSKVKKRAGDFLLKIHDARKVQPDGRGKDIASLHFVNELQGCFAGLEVDLMDPITMLAKYHDFIKNMIFHWKERVKNGHELDKDAVVEVSVQMMASVLAMAYPVFIKIADTISKLVTGLAESVKLKSDPNKIVDRLHLFVELLTSEIAGIGISAGKVMKTLPGITEETLKEQDDKLAAQIKYANNSIAWAMKSLGPLLLYYYLQCEISHAD